MVQWPLYHHSTRVSPCSRCIPQEKQHHPIVADFFLVIRSKRSCNAGVWADYGPPKPWSHRQWLFQLMPKSCTGQEYTESMAILLLFLVANVEEFFHDLYIYCSLNFDEAHFSSDFSNLHLIFNFTLVPFSDSQPSGCSAQNIRDTFRIGLWIIGLECGCFVLRSQLLRLCKKSLYIYIYIYYTLYKYIIYICVLKIVKTVRYLLKYEITRYITVIWKFP